MDGVGGQVPRFLVTFLSLSLDKHTQRQKEGRTLEWVGQVGNFCGAIC